VKVVKTQKLIYAKCYQKCWVFRNGISSSKVENFEAFH